ncbi:MAG: crossover junction endodeoxyribonuclease RuvC [Candidatus Gracilibacteria bacterium]|nr:crossover junction endodeoxyribonuclease RuvC [Candidatus Gracilibacteria bacterium]
MRILGIDPGTTTIGFAILDKNGMKNNIVDYGVFSTTPKMELSVKLLEIGMDMKEIIKKYNPDIVSIEKLFFQTNVKTGIDVSHARGVIMYECIKSDIKIVEYTPLQVKKAITGHGSCNKLQLQNAIKMIFRMEEIPKPDDAADAIGLAYMGALNSNFIINRGLL